MRLRSPFRNVRRKLLIGALSLATAGGILVVTPMVANAHGAPTAPGSRTYLCYQDLNLHMGDQQPRNSQCAAAVAKGTTQPLYDWFGVLRSDGAGRMSGFIPDGQLCEGGNTKWAAYDDPGTAWPVTHLTSGAPWTFHYNAWAAHPGGFRLFITKDGYDPSQPLKWSDLESTPFSTWSETTPNGSGEYYWDTVLPKKTGRHIIYTVWARTDSTETFYSCSDVVFDGGSGKVTGIPGYDGDTGDGTSPTTTTAPPVTTTVTPVTTTTKPPVTTTAAVTTTTRPPVTTTVPVTTTAGPVGNSTCTAQFTASAWSGGYQGNLTVLNKGSALNPWTVTFTTPSGVAVQSGWNGDFTTSGSTVTVKAPSWATSLGSNAQISLGFIANGPASPLPNNVKLNGVACDGAGGVTPTTTAAPVTTTTRPPVTTAPVTTAPVTTAPATTVPVTTGPSTGCANGNLICDGFEGQTSGAAPSGKWSVVTPDCSGTGKAVVDTSVVHSGSSSLRIDGGAGFCDHVFAQSSTALNASTIYARVWIRHSTPQPTTHTTMIAMNDSNDGGKNLRIGGQGGALQWNRESDDATLPEQSPSGIALSTALPTGGWQCLEFKVDGSGGTAQTWVNGTEVAGLKADGVKTTNIDSQWYSKSWKPLVSNLKLGWEAYGGNTDTLWYDDVAVGTSRIGC